MNRETPRQTPFCIVLTTVPDEAQAESLARQIVATGLRTCVQVHPIESHYLWKGEACAVREWRLDIKTCEAFYPRLEAFIRMNHGYETPEILQVPIEAGSADYLAWLAAGSAG